MSKFSDDCKRFILCDQTNLVKALLFTQGVWAMANYRVAHAVYKKLNVPVLAPDNPLLDVFVAKIG